MPRQIPKPKSCGINYSLAQVCLGLNLNPHDLVQRDDLYNCQEWTVGLESLFQIANNWFDNFIQRHRDVYPQFVNLFQAFAAGVLQGVLYVIEGLVNLIW
jgi:hypothetical protein